MQQKEKNKNNSRMHTTDIITSVPLINSQSQKKKWVHPISTSQNGQKKVLCF